MEAESWDAAIACFDQAVRCDSELTEAYLLRATAINEIVVRCFASGKPSIKYSRTDALRDLESAIRLRQDCGEAYLQKGFALAGLAQMTEARDAFSQAINHLADPTKAQVERAAIHFHLGDFAAAVADMTAVLDRHPLEPNYYETRAIYRRHAGDFRNSRYDNAKAARLHQGVAGVTPELLKSLENDGGDYQGIAEDQKAAEVLTESKRLGGKWQVLSKDAMGRSSDTEDQKFYLDFMGNRYRLALDGAIQQEDLYLLDPAELPRKIDLLGTVQGKAVAFLGIYERDRSSLRICVARPGEARPTEFTTEGHPERTMYKLKQVVDRK